MATASWFRPEPTAFGNTYPRYSTIGFAHKGWSYGHRVWMHFKHYTAHPQTVDHGPYVAGRDFDLTGGLKDKLHFPDGVAQIQWAHHNCWSKR